MRNLFNNIGKFIDVLAKVMILKKAAGDLRNNPDPVKVLIFLDEFDKLTDNLDQL